jgi:hypothetical protein
VVPPADSASLLSASHIDEPDGLAVPSVISFAQDGIISGGLHCTTHVARFSMVARMSMPRCFAPPVP